MAKARGLRPRALSGIFGAYFLVVIALAYFLSSPVSVYVDLGATRWICLAYALLGAAMLGAVCVAAVRRWATLDTRLMELEHVAHQVAAAASRDTGAPTAEPTDRDVDQLLEDLSQIEETAEQEKADVALTALTLAPPPADSDLPDERAREIRRVRRALDAVGAYAAGPAVASSVLLGVFTALTPGADGMLVANLQLNAFVGLAGLGCLAGIAVYAAVSFRQLRRRAV